MHHVNQDCGRTFKAKCYEQGTREGSIYIYKNGAYPHEAIGRVSFLWDTCVQDNIRALWIWAEPLIYAQLAKELQTTFNLKQNDSDILESGPPVLKKPKLLEIIKNSKNTAIPAVQTPSFINSTIKMTLLKGSLNRLRLTGPLSNSVLSRVLYPAVMVNSKNFIDENWWSSRLKDLKNSTDIQTKLWESLNGADRPESYPSNCVIGFHTIDPRLVFPMKRTKALPSSKGF
jgi:hypothetical protein